MHCNVEHEQVLKKHPIFIYKAMNFASIGDVNKPLLAHILLYDLCYGFNIEIAVLKTL